MTKDYLIERNGKKYEVVIGLEVHVQLATKSKIFSGVFDSDWNRFKAVDIYREGSNHPQSYPQILGLCG